MPGELDFYAIILFLHIGSAIVAFGVTFAFPVIFTAIQRGDVSALPAWHEAEIQIGRKLITPGAILVLLTGIYLAIDRWSDSGPWFSVAGVIVIVLLGLGHGFFVPQSRKMKAQAEADLAAGAADRGTMSAEYEAIGKRVAMVGTFSSLLVLVALLLMVWKPGA